MTTPRLKTTPIKVPLEVEKLTVKKGPHYNGSHITCTWGDVIWAAISVGRAGLTQMNQHGHFSTCEIAYRAAVIEANIDLDSSGAPIKSPSLGELDPSEKNAMSYYAGMAFTKLFAGLNLDIPWLLHVDKNKSIGLTFAKNSKVRPDLVGCDTSGDWHAFEAKGRSGAFSESPIATAKRQLAKLKLIQGKAPKSRLACLTYFRRDELNLYCEDPPSGSSWYELDISDDFYFGTYYAWIQNYLNRLSGQWPTMELEELGLSISLDREVRKLIEAREWDQLRSWSAAATHRSEPDRVVGRDGIIVKFRSHKT